jgi:protoheme IX farnesyltransferase
LNGVAAVAGYMLFPGNLLYLPLLALFVGVVLQAAGGSALNQVLERDLDCLMSRTKSRPLPAGQLTPLAATAVGIFLILAGVFFLLLVGGVLPALLSVAALIVYLAIYTPLKRHTPFALLIGALCGALPPLIGWSLAGGAPTDYRIVIMAGLLYLWQIPHFWLFQRRYERDYLLAGIPLFQCHGTDLRRNFHCWLWVVALMATLMLLPAFGIIDPHLARWYLLFPVPLIFMFVLRFESALFFGLNLFPVMLTILLTVQKYQNRL